MLFANPEDVDSDQQILKTAMKRTIIIYFAICSVEDTEKTLWRNVEKSCVEYLFHSGF